MRTVNGECWPARHVDESATMAFATKRRFILPKSFNTVLRRRTVLCRKVPHLKSKVAALSLARTSDIPSNDEILVIMVKRYGSATWKGTQLS
jgi:hypothetical protein